MKKQAEDQLETVAVDIIERRLIREKAAKAQAKSREASRAASQASSKAESQASSQSSGDSSVYGIADLLGAPDENDCDSSFVDAVLRAKLGQEKIRFLKAIQPITRFTSLEDGAKIAPESNAEWWRKNWSEFPNLYELAAVLFNIPASSSYAERFFSVCGYVCKTRSGNENGETIILRSMLRANYEYLEELSNQE